LVEKKPVATKTNQSERTQPKIHVIRWQQMHSVMEATLMMAEQKRVSKGTTQSVHGQLPETAQYVLYSKHCSFSYPPQVKGISPTFLLTAQYNFDNFHHLSLLLTLSTASVRRTSKCRWRYAINTQCKGDNEGRHSRVCTVQCR